MKKLQITISDTKSTVSKDQKISKEPVLKLNISVGGKNFDNIAVNLDQVKEQTIILDVSDAPSEIKNIIFNKGDSPSYTVSYKIKSIKAIYK